MTEGTAVPQPWEIVRELARELEKPRVYLRTEQFNALDAFDTHNWGDEAKRHIAAALRDALARAVPEVSV